MNMGDKNDLLKLKEVVICRLILQPMCEE